MGRLHSNGKGISASAVPYSRNPPSWLKTTPDQVVEQICKLAKKGATPSQIGVVLRDSHGIAQVKVVTGMFFCPYPSMLHREWMDGMDGLVWENVADNAVRAQKQVTRSSGSSSPAVRVEPHLCTSPIIP